MDRAQVNGSSFDPVIANYSRVTREYAALVKTMTKIRKEGNDLVNQGKYHEVARCAEAKRIVEAEMRETMRQMERCEKQLKRAFEAHKPLDDESTENAEYSY
jgi:protein subunit release factor A